MSPADLNKASKGHCVDVREVIAAWVRARGLRGLDSQGSAHVRVLTLDEVARRCSTTRRNIERLNADGAGPAVVQISPRKIGVLEKDLEVWLESRRRPAPGKAAEKDGQNI
jgi:predicted DNA-binding transcriptional regulator AlpA